MRNTLRIENIEAIRNTHGIEDVELREEIRRLTVKSLVRLTFLNADSGCGETLLVRITRIQESTYRGKLASSPISPGLADLHIGSPVVFTAAQIHSIPGGRPAQLK